MADEQHAPSIADASKPNAGRIYDYVLGGHHNFEVDRLTAQQILKFIPDYPQMARYVRWFLGEAVRRLAGEGYVRFIDFASGLPTVDHIHQVTPPGTKVIYSDIDPVTVAYGQEVIKEAPNARYLVCEAGKPETLLNSSVTKEFLGTNHKVVFGFNGIAFFLSDEQIAHAMKTLYEWADEGSRLFLCDFDVDPSLQIDEASNIFEKMGQPVHWRSSRQLLQLVSPWREGQGFKPIEDWIKMSMRPEDKKTIFADRLRGAILEK